MPLSAHPHLEQAHIWLTQAKELIDDERRRIRHIEGDPLRKAFRCADDALWWVEKACETEEAE